MAGESMRTAPLFIMEEDMATITFTNLTVSGNMGFKEISFDTFRRILDFVETQTNTNGAITTGADLNDLSEGTIKEAEVTVQGNAAEVIATDEEPVVEKEEPPKIDPYLLVGNYAGKDSVVRILKDYTGNPEGYRQEWMTTRQWMEKVELDPAAKLFAVAHILSDCAKVGLLERRADYNPEEHKNEVRFLLPIPIPGKVDETIKELEDEPIVTTVTTEDYRRGNKVRSARMEAGFSVAELAELLHTDAGTVVKWENGIYRITGSVEEDLKKLFGNGLFDGTENEHDGN